MTIVHKEFETVEAATDTGERRGAFIALVSTFGPEPDRQGERVVRGAFRRSLERWRESGSQIPLLADHAGKVAAVVGHVDPRLTIESGAGLEAAGTFDLSTSLGKRTYELVKRRALSWSIGFTVPEGGRRRRQGITELVTVDLAEISVVPVPADRGARTLSIKSAEPIELVSFEVA